MKFFVTGGTGFVGRVLVRELAASHGPANVVCLLKPDDSELERTGRAALDELGVQTLEGDIRTWAPAPEEIPDFDVLFHLAATIDNIAHEHSTNDEGTGNLLRVLGSRLAGRRVVYTSTTALMDCRGRTTSPLDEKSPVRPFTAYGRTKLRAEELVVQQSRRWQYSYTILRLGLVYGPDFRREGFFGLFSSWVRTGHFLARIPWPGKTGIVFVDDAARVLMSTAVDPMARDELFCVVAESPEIREIVREMARAAGCSYDPLPVPEWIWSALRAALGLPGLFSILPRSLRGHVWRLNNLVNNGLWCDSSKLRSRYPDPMTELAAGMRRMLSREDRKAS